MEYNTERGLISIPEYGRNIQKMIDYCVDIEDRDKRNSTAHAIVRVMEQMNSQASKANDFHHKLWDHLHIISGFRLDIDAPYPAPSKEDVAKKPEKIEYSKKRMTYPHYGKNIEKVISVVAEEEDGEKKDAIILAIANYLKKSYLTWNRDSVNDETILKHLEELSKGKLELKEDTQMISTSDALSVPRRQKNIVNKKNTSYKGINKKRKRK